ncbi:Centrosomal protein, partial [Stegodyphus mimosarum]
MYSKQKSLTFGHYAPNDKVLNKKIPENPKYKHVKPAIDTGKNIRRHIDELKEKQKNLSHKKDEVFKRVKFSTFMRLALASALECLSTQNDNGDAKEISDSNSDAEPNKQLENKRVANVLMGIGELDIINEKKKPFAAPPEPVKKLSYLLLDVRDRDEFQRCHILTAKHYPAALLSRSMGYETEELKL